MTWLPVAGERWKAVWAWDYRCRAFLELKEKSMPCYIVSLLRWEAHVPLGKFCLEPPSSSTFMQFSCQDKLTGSASPQTTSSGQSWPWTEYQRYFWGLSTLLSLPFVILLGPVLSSVWCLVLPCFSKYPRQRVLPYLQFHASFPLSTQTTSVECRDRQGRRRNWFTELKSHVKERDPAQTGRSRNIEWWTSAKARVLLKAFDKTRNTEPMDEAGVGASGRQDTRDRVSGATGEE